MNRRSFFTFLASVPIGIAAVPKIAADVAAWDTPVNANAVALDWTAGCTVKPYLNCDGAEFCGETYPQLRAVLDGTTLPDANAKFRLLN
jgi:hypothetical protein